MIRLVKRRFAHVRQVRSQTMRNDKEWCITMLSLQEFRLSTSVDLDVYVKTSLDPRMHQGNMIQLVHEHGCTDAFWLRTSKNIYSICQSCLNQALGSMQTNFRVSANFEQGSLDILDLPLLSVHQHEHLGTIFRASGSTWPNILKYSRVLSRPLRSSARWSFLPIPMDLLVNVLFQCLRFHGFHGRLSAIATRGPFRFPLNFLWRWDMSAWSVLVGMIGHGEAWRRKWQDAGRSKSFGEPRSFVSDFGTILYIQFLDGVNMSKVSSDLNFL